MKGSKELQLQSTNQYVISQNLFFFDDIQKNVASDESLFGKLEFDQDDAIMEEIDLSFESKTKCILEMDTSLADSSMAEVSMDNCSFGKLIVEDVDSSTEEDGYVTLTYFQLFNCMKSAKSQKSQIESCENFIREKLGENIWAVQEKYIQVVCTSFVKKVRDKLRHCSHKYHLVEKLMHTRLQSTIVLEKRRKPDAMQIDQLDCHIPEKQTPPSSRFKKDAKAARRLEKFSPKTLINVAARKLRFEKKFSKARQIQQAALSSPVTLGRHVKPQVLPERITPEEALCMILDLQLTRDQYDKIAQNTRAHKANIYPCYTLVQREKTHCRPMTDFEVSEGKAKVSLQSLLDHTASRILKILTDQNQADLSAHLTLICSWGFDGSSGQALYKHKYESKWDRSNLLTTHVIPLQIHDRYGNSVWNNPTPQSVRFCRPLKLEFVKDTPKVIIAEKESVEKEIRALQPFTIKYQGQPVTINYDLSMTLIDGKVLSTVLGTPCALTCPICKRSASSLNKIETFQSDEIDSTRLKYGMSPLHAWIRFFEFLLRLSYKLPVKKWRITSLLEKTIVRKQKRYVQEAMEERLGLLVDIPKAGGSGSTNDGNTARKAFANAEVFSEITGIDLDLIKDFRTILMAINCDLQIDGKKFDLFCMNVARRYVLTYNWCNLTPTVHKVLIHGHQIIQQSVLPIGMLGEEAAEARNKFYKHNRLHHARKDNPIHNMTDLFWRTMDHSDPYLSTLQVSYTKRHNIKKTLPVEVIELLKDADANIGKYETLCLFSEEFAVDLTREELEENEFLDN